MIDPIHIKRFQGRDLKQKISEVQLLSITRTKSENSDQIPVRARAIEEQFLPDNFTLYFDLWIARKNHEIDIGNMETDSCNQDLRPESYNHLHFSIKSYPST